MDTYRDLIVARWQALVETGQVLGISLRPMTVEWTDEFDGAFGEITVGEVTLGDWYEIDGWRVAGDATSDAAAEAQNLTALGPLVLTEDEVREFEAVNQRTEAAMKQRMRSAARTWSRAPRRTHCGSGRPAARRTATATRGSPDDDDGPSEPAPPHGRGRR